MSDGIPIVGQPYRISCIVLVPEGITNPVGVEWHNSEGRLSNSSDITVGQTVYTQSNITSSLVLNPFRTTHEGRFSCRATLITQTPPFNVSKTADVNIIVGGMFSAIAATILC